MIILKWLGGPIPVANIEPSIGDLVIRSLAALEMSAWIAGVREPSSDKEAPPSYLDSDDKG